MQGALERGVNYRVDKITRENMASKLSGLVKAGDILIDLAWNIDCLEIVKWCHDHEIRYINTSVEVWDPYLNTPTTKPVDRTLYVRHRKLRSLINSFEKKGASAVVEHGANPGLVSHFTKSALLDIGEKILKEKAHGDRAKNIEKALADKNFPLLALLSGTKVIHISERDTQISKVPKVENEFVNTWSIEGFYEEGLATAEMGWGTHERNLPPGAHIHSEGPLNQICLAQPGIKTKVRSWVPAGEIVGMVIRHGEAFTISDYLTVREDGQAIYRPTVHYAYCPSDSAIASLLELEMRQFQLQEKQRILNDEIVSGRDELGVLLMGHDFKSWWIGSLLDINESRIIAPHQNATTVQVAISVIAALEWLITNPHEGVKVPDELPYEQILARAKPYLGEFISQPVNWDPTMNRRDLELFQKFRTDTKLIGPDDMWQFSTFQIE